MQVSFVTVELFGRVNERLVAALLFVLQLLDFLLHCVVGQLCQEHFLLLVNELVCILSPVLFGELHTTASNVHGFVDVVDLLRVVVFASLPHCLSG